MPLPFAPSSNRLSGNDFRLTHVLDRTISPPRVGGASWFDQIRRRVTPKISKTQIHNRSCEPSHVLVASPLGADAK